MLGAATPVTPDRRTVAAAGAIIVTLCTAAATAVVASDAQLIHLSSQGGISCLQCSEALFG
jgi:hypothetical protein